MEDEGNVVVIEYRYGVRKALVSVTSQNASVAIPAAAPPPNVGGTKHSLSKSSKDGKLSNFHSLGRIIYCKRDAETKRLEFEPERSVEQGDLSLEGVLAYVAHHGIGFFDDEGELWSMLDLCSEIDVLLGRKWDGLRDRGDKNFPEEYERVERSGAKRSE